MLLAHHMMFNTLSRPNVDHRLMKRRHAVRSNDVVLTECQTSWARRSRAQTTRVLESEEFAQLSLWRLTQVDLAEVDDSVGMSGNDGTSGEVGLLFGEDSERVEHIGRD